MSGRVIFLKQSGELLSTPKPEVSVEDGAEALFEALQQPRFNIDNEMVEAQADNIARAYKLRGQFGVTGMVIVPGGGNIVRGDMLVEQGMDRVTADAMGRLGTIINAHALSSALIQMGVPTQELLTANMDVSDPDYGQLTRHANGVVNRAHGLDRVVVIGGGTGEGGVTTDNAVVQYAARYKSAFPEDEAVVIKGTKVEGVYEGNPDKDPTAVRYGLIGAAEMLEHYDKYRVVDKSSLEALIEHELNMRIYKDNAYDLSAILELDPTVSTGASIGTLITHHEVEKVVAH